MEVKYLGPMDKVFVAPYGPHYKDEVREYPDDFAAELMATSKRQRFETEPSDPADMTVNQLRQVLKDLDVEVPANAKKIELVNLVRATAGVFAKS